VQIVRAVLGASYRLPANSWFRRHTAGDVLPAVCHVVSARPAFGLLEAACGAVQLP